MKTETAEIPPALHPVLSRALFVSVSHVLSILLGKEPFMSDKFDENLEPIKPIDPEMRKMLEELFAGLDAESARKEAAKDAVTQRLNEIVNEAGGRSGAASDTARPAIAEPFTMRETNHSPNFERLLVTLDLLGSKIDHLVERTGAPVTMTDNGQCVIINGSNNTLTLSPRFERVRSPRAATGASTVKGEAE